jgi:uncharacterized protein
MSWIFLMLIKFYQLALSPFIGKSCRFYPSCSDYCHDAIVKYGAWKGLWRGIIRLVKCGPWHKGGVDFP